MADGQAVKRGVIIREQIEVASINQGVPAAERSVKNAVHFSQLEILGICTGHIKIQVYGHGHELASIRQRK